MRLGKLEKKALVSLLQRDGYATRMELLCDIWPELEIAETYTATGWRYIYSKPREVTRHLRNVRVKEGSDISPGSCQVQMSRVLDSLERKGLVETSNGVHRKRVTLTSKGRMRAHKFIKDNN